MNCARNSKILPAAIFAIPLLILSGIVHASTPWFTLSKINADSAFYFLMSIGITEGSSHILLTEGGSPLNYSSGVSWLYATLVPFLDSYPARIRWIQVCNLLTITLTFFLWGKYVARKVSFPRRTWIPVVTGIIVAMDGRWQRAAILPNSDALTSLLTISALLLILPVLQKDNISPRSTVARWIAVFLAAVPGFLVKMTLPVLVVAPLLVEIVRNRKNKWILILAALTLLSTALVATADRGVILYQGAVFKNITQNHSKANTTDSVLAGNAAAAVENLVFAALPDQIIPNFQYTFRTSLESSRDGFQRGRMGADVVAGMIAGLLITGIILTGAIHSWRQFRLELLMLAIVLPLYALVTTATFRYLMPFQVIFILFFIDGLLWLLSLLRPRLRTGLVLLFVLVFVPTLAAVQVRSSWMRLRGASDSLSLVRDIDDVYGKTASFLQSIEGHKVRIAHLNDVAVNTNRWHGIVDFPQREIDDVFIREAGETKSLVVLVAERRDLRAFDPLRDKALSMIRQYGDSHARLVFSRANDGARAEIYEVVRDTP